MLLSCVITLKSQRSPFVLTSLVTGVRMTKISFSVLWCLVSSAIAADIEVKVSPGWRAVPLLGLGNELVFQSINDTVLAKAVRDSGSVIARYPGGTPSDYWLATIGWINVTSDQSGCARYPLRQSTPAQWRQYWGSGASDLEYTVIVVNQLQTNITYELDNLRLHATAGTSVRFVELGNEMYDATRSDVVKTYPTGREYAAKMQGYTSAIKAAFPNAKVALVGTALAYDARSSTWNDEVLNHPASSQADAATIHMYPGLPPGPIRVANLSRLLAFSFSAFRDNRDHVQKTIPQRYRLWLTEWGTWGNENLLDTYLQGLWHGAFTMLLPQLDRLDMLMPYCIVCADVQMPSFTTKIGPMPPPNSTHNDWFPTLSGLAYSRFFAAVKEIHFGPSFSGQLSPLVFSPNPVLDASVPESRQLIGWALRNTAKGPAVSKLILFNLAGEVSINLNGALDQACLQNAKYTTLAPRTPEDVIRQRIPLSDLITNAGQVTGGRLQVPHYSLTTVQC